MPGCSIEIFGFAKRAYEARTDGEMSPGGDNDAGVEGAHGLGTMGFAGLRALHGPDPRPTRTLGKRGKLGRVALGGLFGSNS
jgi:hypothetical protein